MNKPVHIRSLICLCSALALLIALPASAPAAGAGLQKDLNRLVANPHGPPGISVLIRRHGHSRYMRSGVARVRGHAPLRPVLRMRIASVAKAFNGAVALALIDRGKLRLGDTIGEILPSLWPKARKVTVRQMLQHRGGLPEYIENPEFIAALREDPRQYLTPRQIVGFVDHEHTDFTPGSRYQYSDTDNLVVGLMAEKVTGRSYDALLRRLVFGPAGLRHTSLPRTVEMPKPYMHGYEISASGKPEESSEAINPALAWASGGIVSTAYDLGRFFRAYVGGKLFDSKVRKAQVRSLVLGTSSPPGPGHNRAGLALFRYRTRCGTVYGHTGSFPGYRQFAAATRDGKASVVFTVNAQIVPRPNADNAISDSIRRAQAKAVCKILG